jgi:hypothetical protein
VLEARDKLMIGSNEILPPAGWKMLPKSGFSGRQYPPLEATWRPGSLAKVMFQHSVLLKNKNYIFYYDLFYHKRKINHGL